jgi:hypothetical protein
LAEISRRGLSVEALEESFARWLAERAWMPISVAADMAVFVGEDGALLDVQRSASGERLSALRITARRRIEEVDIEISVEVDPATYQPRLERIQFETPDRTTVLSLTAQRVETIPTPALVESLFEPELGRRAARPSPPPQVREPSAPEPPAPVAAFNLDAAEMEVRYALHRAGACLGDPIELVRDAEKGITVRGITNTDARKSELLRNLATLKAPVWLKIDIRTIEEALRDDVLETPLPTDALADAGGGRVSTEFSQTIVPAQEQLTRHFDSLDGADTNVADWTAAFTHEAVTQAGELLSEAWAIRRLAENYDRQRVDELPPAARYLLEAMLKDHSRALRRKTLRLQGHLEPFLDGAVEGVEEAPGRKEMALNTDDWRAVTLALFQSIDSIHRRTTGLFAGAGLTVSADEQSSALRLESPEEAMAALLGEIRMTNRGVQALSARHSWNITTRESASTK